MLSLTTTAQKKFKPGQIFSDCKGCPEMVVIPAGQFMIGSPDNEPGRVSSPDEGAMEGPQRIVHIRQFAAGKFDITKSQWAAFVKETNWVVKGGCSWAELPGDTLPMWQLNPNANWNNIGFAQDSSHPVVCVSWEDAKEYIDWLSKKAGFTYRLLSEAEWEYAGRAGATTAFPWGNTASHEYANYGTDSTYTALKLGRDQWLGTSPVGSFPPNDFGLYDMNGNVMQWVEDCFSNSYEDLPGDGSPYRKEVVLKTQGRFLFMNGKSSCDFHMVRGGCYSEITKMMRTAYRNWSNIPGASNPDICRSAGAGFRVARTL
ncbi:MAG: formylglycine-generating enzyme family protein [Chitinophagaceae bacterium]|nr:MAG: formylglycine-generating enzyme family protein [Chitinophagaceae bacterium]